MTAESKTYGLFLWPWCLSDGYSAQAIKECIDYELKSSDNSYVLTNFCKLLSLTFYIFFCWSTCVLNLCSVQVPTKYLLDYQIQIQFTVIELLLKSTNKLKIKQNLFFIVYFALRRKTVNIVQAWVNLICQVVS